MKMTFISMARTGVSYTEVAEAATQLVGQGRNPTVEQVRLLLGTGSSTTIANHLRHWKSNQEATNLISAKENIPPELVAVMKGLWERVIDYSQEQVIIIENDYQNTIAELQQELEKYKTNNQRWQKLHDQWVAEKNKLSNDKLTVEQTIEFAHKENASLHAKQDVLLQQLRDKQERIDELHHLHKQTQTNLEHYRESAREQRLLDQQEYENQKQQLQSDIKKLKTEYELQREKNQLLQQDYQTLQQTHLHLEKNHINTQDDLKKIKIKLDDSEKSNNEYLSTNKSFQIQVATLQKSLDEKTNKYIEFQSDNKVLSQQLASIKQVVIDLEQTNKLLTQEKWELRQEKAMLEKQVKQMQDTITA